MQIPAMARPAASPQDKEAQLFAELYEPLRRFAAVVGPIEVEPEDLLQEAVVRVLQRRHLTDLDEPGAYLRRAIVNLASNHRRHFAVRRKAMQTLRADSGSTRDEYPSDLAELGSLAPHERAALYLSQVEGYRYAEIAQMLGCSEAAARKRTMRARRRLVHVSAEETANG